MSKIWYNKPANDWNEALPLGNGFIGAMVFGNVSDEKYSLNEDSLWYGGFRDRVNPDAIKALPEIRRLLKEDELQKAQALAESSLTAIPEGERHYEPLADLNFSSTQIPFDNYKRELDLDRGICTVSFSSNDKKYSRESFISYPRNVLVISYKGDPCRITLNRGKYCSRIVPFNQNSLYLEGQTGDGGVKYATTCTVVGEGVQTKGATIMAPSEFTLYLSAATSFRHDDPLAVAKELVNKAIELGYEKVKSEHIDDFTSLTQRCCLDLYDPKAEKSALLPTDERLKAFNGKDLSLVNDYFAFGRYLLISCSREGSLPSNLQGIWNKDFLPAWDSKFTININTEMNYWPAEVLGLSTLHTPLFDHIQRMLPHGQQVARKMYGVDGFVAHHNTDIWGDCAPQDLYPPATYWQMGAAWLCTHIAEHYFFTKDKEFLKKNITPMKEAARFLINSFIEKEDGTLTISPSVSPENVYKTENGATGVLTDCAAMDAQISYELLKDLTICLEDLSEDASEYKKALERLTPVVCENGLVKEWLRKYSEIEVGHRHISHLFALYPGSQIDSSNKEAFECAKNTLNRRLSSGGGHTGWSRAWIICMWARLLEGDNAWDNIRLLLQRSTLPNLFDNHPPFQIDGNFGSIAGIAEMLLQSHNGELALLPALPKAWKKGSVTGLRARGGYNVSIKWDEDGYEASIIPKFDGSLKIKGGETISHKKDEPIIISKKFR